MQNVKNALLNDLDQVLANGTEGAAYAAWLMATLAKFDGWRSRIVGG